MLIWKRKFSMRIVRYGITSNGQSLSTATNRKDEYLLGRMCNMALGHLEKAFYNRADAYIGEHRTVDKKPTRITTTESPGVHCSVRAIQSWLRTVVHIDRKPSSGESQCPRGRFRRATAVPRELHGEYPAARPTIAPNFPATLGPSGTTSLRTSFNISPSQGEAAAS